MTKQLCAECDCYIDPGPVYQGCQCPKPTYSKINDTQSKPIPNTGPAIWNLVIQDIETIIPPGMDRDRLITDARKRDELGHKRYGTRLQAHNGRKPLLDAYEEGLDLMVYLRQAIEETPTSALLEVYRMSLLSAQMLCELLAQDDDNMQVYNDFA